MVIKNLSQNNLYLILIGIFIIFATLGVYALTPGVEPNPGHVFSEVSPNTCSAGQIVYWSLVNGFYCSDISNIGIWGVGNGYINYLGGNVGINTNSEPTENLYVKGTSVFRFGVQIGDNGEECNADNLGSMVYHVECINNQYHSAFFLCNDEGGQNNWEIIITEDFYDGVNYWGDC